MSKSTEAVLQFSKGFNCAQVVLSAFSKELGLDRDTALKIACGFGGGMGQGEVCGAVSAAIMVIGLKYGRSKVEDTESKTITNNAAKNFAHQFKSLNGSIICKNLLGCDVSTEGGKNLAVEKGLFTNICPKLIKDCIDILEDILSR